MRSAFESETASSGLSSHCCDQNLVVPSYFRERPIPLCVKVPGLMLSAVRYSQYLNRIAMRRATELHPTTTIQLVEMTIRTSMVTFATPDMRQPRTGACRLALEGRCLDSRSSRLSSTTSCARSSSGYQLDISQSTARALPSEPNEVGPVANLRFGGEVSFLTVRGSIAWLSTGLRAAAFGAAGAGSNPVGRALYVALRT